MKTPRLPPDTDLACIAPLSTDGKRSRLLALKAGFSPWSYDPTRKRVPDLVNASGSLLESTGPTSLHLLEAEIERACKNNSQGIASNLEVARLAYEAHRDGCLEAFQQPFGRYYVAPGESISYWSDVFMLLDGKPLIPFYDFRRHNGLTRIGARFAASVMHLKIVTDFDEFADARLLLMQFPQVGSSRIVSSRLISRDDLYGYDQVSAMISEVRSIWYEINDERTDEVRRSGKGGGWWR